MKNNWPTKKLGEICDINGGNAAPQDYAVFSSDGVPFVRMQDLGRYHITDNLTATRDKIKREAIDKLGIKIFSRGSIILPRSGSVFANHRAILGIDAAVVSHIAILNNFKGIKPKYLFWYLTILDIGRHAVKTSNVDSISFQRLKKFEIPLPPLQVQKQIVERLDKIIEAQELNDKQIELAEELYRSLLHSELNVKVKNQNAKSQIKIKKLEEIAEVTSSKRIYQSEYVEVGIPFYRTKEIVELSQNKPISLELFISKKRFNEINKKFGVPEKGDILISAVGTIGISWVVPDNRKFYFKDGNLLWIRNLKGVDSIFLKMILDNFARNIARMGAGAAYNALTIIKLKKVQILVPPIETQKQIVEKLSAVQEYKKKLIEQKSKLKELFESILHKSITT